MTAHASNLGLRQSAVAAHQQGRHAQALEEYSQFLAVQPEDAGIWSNLGVILRIMGRHTLALRAHQRAAFLSPLNTGIQNNLANILSDLGQYEDSILIREAILETEPDHLDHLAMLGRCYRGKGNYQGAIEHLETAIKRHPNDAELQMQRAFALLGDRQYAAGFDAYTARWSAGEIEPRKIDLPEWQGQSLDNKTIVVLPEQGFGDAVLFMRFLPFLKSKGANVKVCAEGPMLKLFQSLEGADEVLATKQENLSGDYWINMIDVARAYFAENSEIPSPSRLHIPDESTDRAAGRMEPYKKSFKIGIVWTGSETYKGNRFRSFHHSEFEPLLGIDGVQLFSLYKGPALDAFRQDGTAGLVIDAAGDDRHFGDCAATMMEMDLVITSDTATAHIAGSLGIPTWVLLHWDPFWVWTHHGETTAWYPTAKLFRQTIPLDWESVMVKVARALEVELAAFDD